MASIYTHQAGIFKNCLLGAIMNKRKLTYYPFLFACEQFIPMCIGNTFWVIILAVVSAVYPYVYREHSMVDAVHTTENGLSLCV